MRFEVVPGVPVCIAAPAYTGVPISYSGGGDTITLIRGYEDEGKAERDIDIDWIAESVSPRRHARLLCQARSSCRRSVQALIAHAASG